MVNLTNADFIAKTLFNIDKIPQEIILFVVSNYILN